MSRYLVDKFLYRVDRDPAMHEAYGKDPAGFVARWEKEDGPKLNEAERTSAHALSEEERRALSAMDYEALYAMGAHPFILWTTMLPYLQGDEPDFRKVAERYKERIRKYGRPDYAT